MQEKIDRVQILAKAFSPSAPIDQRALFAGRLSQLVSVLNAVEQKGQHAILFGERGVGKTSLARVISAIVASSNRTIVASINCDQSMTFSSLWKKILREISLVTTTRSPGFISEENKTVQNISHMLPDDAGPDDIRHLFSKLGNTLIVIDELDRLDDKNIATLLADTIKTLSDHAIQTTLLLVGVADSVEALIAEHQSVERALVQIRMPRMSKPELSEIITKGLSTASMKITDEVRNKIVALSQGLPHYTHLLAQSAAQRAAINDQVDVALSDVRVAIDSAIDKAQHSIINSYHSATNSPRENLYRQVLLACALADQDSLGYFAAVDVRSPLSKIMKKAYEIPAFSQHLNAFCESSRGPVLQRIGTARRYRFRFVNPLLQPFVVMNGIKTGLISESDVGT